MGSTRMTEAVPITMPSPVLEIFPLGERLRELLASVVIRLLHGLGGSKVALLDGVHEGTELAVQGSEVDGSGAATSTAAASTATAAAASSTAGGSAAESGGLGGQCACGVRWGLQCGQRGTELGYLLIGGGACRGRQRS